ncbi:FHA domain-containing protein [Haliangium ochraceum]|uniref:FHA domain containing protein n=1 Tax=Haliangium ochraceum (strain DSM 14365 / JCM 11303 / SMP-2) TaxID=502025 RepID=D0LX73_HALO1|nr:FHA domain-containing protein [Haliangium ochraceum]ACY16115.1 FHA domain containing protein [Haliangium ochraceum DSM 14365]
MSTAAIVSVVVGAALLVLIAVILIVRHGGNGGAAQVPRRMCGGCQRAMMPEWDKCMFCGWTPVARIEFLSGPMTGHLIPLSEEVTTVGSVAGNTVVLSDPAVSRKHLGIRRVGSTYELADLGSTNGVYVNGHRMPKKTLVPGDVLRVGNTEMVFRRE